MVVRSNNLSYHKATGSKSLIYSFQSFAKSSNLRPSVRSTTAKLMPSCLIKSKKVFLFKYGLKQNFSHNFFKLIFSTELVLILIYDYFSKTPQHEQICRIFTKIKKWYYSEMLYTLINHAIQSLCIFESSVLVACNGYIIIGF